MTSKLAWNDKSAFVTLYPPKGLIEPLKPLFSEKCWEDKPHVTLAYMGEVTDKQFATAIEVLKDVPKLLKPLSLTIQGGGSFRGSEGANVRLALIGGVNLEYWALAIKSALKRADLMPPEKHGFIPHMTLAYETEPFESGWEIPLLEADDVWECEEFHLLRGNGIEHITYKVG